MAERPSDLSDRIAHIRQAQHNEELAKKLVEDGYQFKDWAVTAAFYAALHYFEARLHQEPPFTYPGISGRIFHSESSIPTYDNSARYRYSNHGWREQLIRRNCDRATVTAYRELRDASQIARYHEGVVASTTAHEHYSNQEVERLITTLLERVKVGLEVV